MIIRMGWPFANDHSDGSAFWKWSAGWAILLQMNIWMEWHFANDHIYWFLPFNQILLHFYFYFQQISYFPPTNIILSFKTIFLLLLIWGSRFNLADLSSTMCSCLPSGEGAPSLVGDHPLGRKIESSKGRQAKLQKQITPWSCRSLAPWPSKDTGNRVKRKKWRCGASLDNASLVWLPKLGPQR